MKTMEIKLTNGKPVFSWCSQIENGAIEQIQSIAKLPFVEHFSVMPDCHQGMSMPIGGVVACSGVVVPDFVGVDIGCGVAAIRTSLTANEIKGKEEVIHHAVNRSIPMGFSHNTDKRREEMYKKFGSKILNDMMKGAFNENAIVKEDALYAQLGTLGGGNHFIELQKDEEDRVWMMVHSGSRNIGKKVCDHFNKIAEELNKMWYSNSNVPFLPVDSKEGIEYLWWMNMALNFAYYNRIAMLDEIVRNLTHYFPNMLSSEVINIHHNYASLENHFGQNVWVHRKGATLASEKTIGLIPGSMGSKSYVVKGKGNVESLCSCSHGAGRKMSRKAFNEQFNTVEKLKEIEDSMNGICHTKFGRAMSRKRKDLGMFDVSEAPQAYKDIDVVIEEEKDLIGIEYTLFPLINWKDSGE